MKKKLLPILLLVVIVFNFIFCNCVYADPGETIVDYDRYGGNQIISQSEVDEITGNGKDTQGNTFNHEKFGPTISGMLLQSVAGFINTFPILIQSFMTVLTVNPTDAGGAFSTALNVGMALLNDANHFSIENAVFSRVSIFNINMFNQNNTYTIGLDGSTETINNSKAILKLKESVAYWFYNLRIIAMMINLCILIYVGIRMAFSTIASEEAKYKKMLISWLESMVVLFLLHYIMLIIISLGEIAMNILIDIKKDMESIGAKSFEKIILNQVYNAISQKGGIQFFMYSVFFWFLTAVHIKFFVTYLKRMFTIMFLTVISPFITVTYPIDKIGDGRAQAFQIWLKEYMINVAIQPIHAAVYLIFIFTAGKIAEQAPFVAMIFLLTLGRVENIVRNVLGITGSVKNIDEARGKNKGRGKGGIIQTIGMFMNKK